MEKKNIIFIGPGKSGTTYVYNLLKRNNYDVGTIKESNYFFRSSNYWGLYNKEYKNRIIDFSNTYFWNPNIALKINEKYDSFILVVLKRDPYDRLASHLNYLISRGEINGDWQHYLKNNRDMLLSLSFNWYLSIWQEYFKGRIEVLEFNDLKDQSTLSQRLQELGLNVVDWDVDKYNTKLIGGTVYTRSLFSFGRLLKKCIPNRAVGFLKTWVEPLVIKTFAKRGETVKISREDVIAYLHG